jgi:acyl-coenzyme A thioesterase PaaI-like protein
MSLTTDRNLENILDFIDKVPVPQSDLDFFNSVSHLKHYLSPTNTQYRPVPFYSVYQKPHNPSADLFFARTIASQDTIPHRLLLLRTGEWTIPDLSNEDANGKQSRPFPSPSTPEVVFLFDLRDGMNGFSHTAHGGSMCALLDETLGMCAETHRQIMFKDQKTLLYTAQLNVSFLAPVTTPNVLRVKAWMVGREGRKWRLRAQMDDGFGRVLLETESLWISTREEKI